MMLQPALLGPIAGVQPFFQGYQCPDLQVEPLTPPTSEALEKREPTEANVLLLV